MIEQKKALLEKKTLKIFLKRYKLNLIWLLNGNVFIALLAQHYRYFYPLLFQKYFSLNTSDWK